MLGMSTQVRSVVRLCGSGGPLTCKPPSSAGAAPRGRFTAGYNVAAAPVNQACATTASNLIDFNDDRGGAATTGISYASAASQAAGMPHHSCMSMAWAPCRPGYAPLRMHGHRGMLHGLPPPAGDGLAACRRMCPCNIMRSL